MLSVTDPGRRSLLASTPRKPYARIPEVLPIPNLIELQLDSFKWFIDHGLRELLDHIVDARVAPGEAEMAFEVAIGDRRDAGA